MDTKKIGAFIALNRKAKGLTQEQLGERLGVTNKTISRWENGNYMPDLSLIDPLSRELGITVNELLAGESIEQERAVEYSEKNIIGTLAYSAEKIRNEHKKISIIIIAVGICVCLGAFIISPPESSWSSIYSIIGLLLFTAGVFREVKAKLGKRILIAAGLFLLILSAFLAIDFVGVRASHRPPIYRHVTETVFAENQKVILYKNPFYNVYRINADSVNEYYIIDTKKEYTLDTVPISPFNRDKSGIDNIIKYKSHYVGDNSNTGALIGSLPLSEHGYVFEIDSEAPGLTIDYHFTDWYGNDDLYIEKSLIYNSASIFALIENVRYIEFNFSGSSYLVTRSDFEANYPGWEKVMPENQLDKNAFNKYVEQKISDTEFAKKMITLFEKADNGSR